MARSVTIFILVILLNTKWISEIGAQRMYTIEVVDSSLSLDNNIKSGKSNGKTMEWMLHDVLESIGERNFYDTKRKLDVMLPVIEKSVKLHFKEVKKLSQNDAHYLNHHDRVHKRHELLRKLKYLKEISEASVRVNGEYIGELLVKLVHSEWVAN